MDQDRPDAGDRRGDRSPSAGPPEHQQAEHQQTEYQQPGYQQAPYQQPEYRQPPYSQQPEYQQLPYQQPEYPQPGYGQPPAAEDPYQQYAPVSYPQSGYGQVAPYGQQYGGGAPEHPQGTIVLILGILGFFTGVTAPFAWYLGSKATREIKASGIAYANETQIRIGRVLGIVVTLLTVLSIVLGGVALAILLSVGAGQF